MSIIPLGLDLDLMDVDMEAKRQAFRAQYHIPDDVIAVGIIGRVVPIKNHALFLEGASKVIQINKKVVFVIIGDGDERPNMEQMCKQLQLDYAYQPTDSRFAEVIFTSWRTDVDCVLAGLDIVMLTSHNEGTPLSLIEAQAASKPVISTNVGGVKDVVLDKQTGFICEPGDVDGLTKAVVTLLGDARLRTSMGELGRHFAMERFSYQRLVVDMKTYYHDLLTKHTRS
jgi:glycosyltransferase involved in cell wall biosynthesis